MNSDEVLELARSHILPNSFNLNGTIVFNSEGLFAFAAAIEAKCNKEFQGRVAPWMQECFGPEISKDVVERNHRFLEESLELVQSLGLLQHEAHQLVDYVYGRPLGEPSQEVGGVMITLAALCLAQGMDMHRAGETELARILQPEVIKKIQRKQSSKPRHFPLPEAPTVSKELAAAQAKQYYMIEKIIDGKAHWWVPDYSQATHWNDACWWTTDSSKARHYDFEADAKYTMGDQMPGCYVTGHIDCMGPNQALDEAIAQAVEPYKQDAERYRWLRDNPAHESLPYFESGKWIVPCESSGAGGFGGGVGYKSYETLSEAIDEAIRAREGK